MLEVLKRWYQTRFSDPDAVTLFLLLVFCFTIIWLFGDLLAPLLVALVMAYLLEWPVARLQKAGLSRTLATSVILILFIAVAVASLLGLIPTLVSQGINLAKEAPAMLTHAQDYVRTLPDKYPELIDVSLVETVIDNIRQRILSGGEHLVSASLSSLVNVVAIMIYLILVPLMVFFMLKDKRVLMGSLRRFLPRNRTLVNRVWVEMNNQIINYIRGKVIEILIVGIATYVPFALMGLRYSVLLAVAVGFSVLIPYIGAAVVTVPVAMVALFQWGLTPEFRLADGGLSGHSGSRWQPAGAGAFLGSGQPPSGGHHHRRAGLRRLVGILGSLLRHSPRHPGQGGDQCLAKT